MTTIEREHKMTNMAKVEAAMKTAKALRKQLDKLYAIVEAESTKIYGNEEIDEHSSEAVKYHRLLGAARELDGYVADLTLVSER